MHEDSEKSISKLEVQSLNRRILSFHNNRSKSTSCLKLNQKPNLRRNKSIISAPAPTLVDEVKKKYSSTENIFLSTTIRAPDVEEIQTCLSRAVVFAVETNFFADLEEDGSEEGVERYYKNDCVIFNEEKYPLETNKTKEDFNRVPKVEEVTEFIQLFMEEYDMDAECAVMTAIYVERLKEETGIGLHPLTWRRIILVALLTACKIWHEDNVWNVDFIEDVLPEMDIADLGRLERSFLAKINYSLSVSPSVYTKYYFELRSLGDKTENLLLTPIDEKDIPILVPILEKQVISGNSPKVPHSISRIKISHGKNEKRAKTVD